MFTFTKFDSISLLPDEALTSKKILVLNATQINHFLFGTVILTVLPSRTILKYVFLLRAYILLDTFDVVCISETHLDYTTSLDDNNLEIARCNLSDHTSTARELVFVYIKKGHLL